MDTRLLKNTAITTEEILGELERTVGTTFNLTLKRIIDDNKTAFLKKLEEKFRAKKITTVVLNYWRNEFFEENSGKNLDELFDFLVKSGIQTVYINLDAKLSEQHDKKLKSSQRANLNIIFEKPLDALNAGLSNQKLAMSKPIASCASPSILKRSNDSTTLVMQNLMESPQHTQFPPIKRSKSQDIKEVECTVLSTASLNSNKGGESSIVRPATPGPYQNRSYRRP